MPGFNAFGRKQDQPAAKPAEPAAAPVAPRASNPAFRPFGKLAAPAPVPATTTMVETIDEADLPQFLKDDVAGTPPTDLPHRMGFRPPR